MDSQPTDPKHELETFRLLVNAVTDYAIFMLDSGGHVATWNSGAERFKGYRAQEIVGRHFSTFYTDEDRAAGVPTSALNTARNTGKFEAEGWRVRKDGTRFWAHVVIDPIYGPDKTLIGYAKITRDLTERREAQAKLDETREALFQSQKMESIGQLTGGIAHDFNNVLAAITGSLELLQRRISNDPRAVLLATNATQAAQRGASLTQRMLAFARRQALAPSDVNLRLLIENMREILDRSLGSYATLVIDMPITLPLVRADATQLEMALLNLALNARDSMPNGGPITITARPDSFQPGNQLGLAPGIYVGLSVRDKGIGMDAETMKRSIEPFFTTKGVGKGTGLGLAMVHGLAEQLDGRLQLASSLGSGTTATLWLPLVREPENATASAAPPVQAGGRKLRVLAVDDDGLVLLNTVMSLEEAGHAVRSAYSGTEALAMLEAEPFDLLVTDQGMPDMTGIELIEAVRGRLPGLPIVLITGYAELPRDLSLDVPVVPKPFRGEQLSDAIRVAVSNAESIGKSVAP